MLVRSASSDLPPRLALSGLSEEIAASEPSEPSEQTEPSRLPEPSVPVSELIDRRVPSVRSKLAATDLPLTALTEARARSERNGANERSERSEQSGPRGQNASAKSRRLLVSSPKSLLLMTAEVMKKHVRVVAVVEAVEAAVDRTRDARRKRFVTTPATMKRTAALKRKSAASTTIQSTPTSRANPKTQQPKTTKKKRFVRVVAAVAAVEVARDLRQRAPSKAQLATMSPASMRNVAKRSLRSRSRVKPQATKTRTKTRLRVAVVAVVAVEAERELPVKLLPLRTSLVMKMKSPN